MCSGGGGGPDPRQVEAQSESDRLLGGAFKPGLEQFNDAVRRNAESLGYKVETPDINNPDAFTASKSGGNVSSLFDVTPKNYTLTQRYRTSSVMGDPTTGAVIPLLGSQQYKVIR